MKRYVEMISGKETHVDVIVPTVYSVPFTERWSLNHSELLFPKAKRAFYFSYPKRKKPKFVQNNISKALINSISRIEPDIIHVNWIYPDGLAIKKLKEFDLPVILQIHGADWYENIVNNRMRSLIRESITFADQVWVVGQKLKRDIGKTFPLNSNKIQVIPNGVNCKNFVPIKNKRNIQSKLGWDSQKVNIVQLAHFRREKGQQDLIEALNILKNKNEVFLHLIGAPVDKNYFEEIRRKIEEYKNLNIQIHSAIDPKRLPKILPAADLFVLPSRIEGFGVALLEAGACGIPLLSTKSGGPEDIITPDIGMLAEASSPGSLAKVLTKMLPTLDTYKSEVIRDSIRKRFDFKVIRKQSLRLYNEILQEERFDSSENPR